MSIRHVVPLVLALHAGCIDASSPPAAGPAAADATVAVDDDVDGGTTLIAFAGSALGGTCATDAECDSAEDAGDGYCLVGMMGPLTFAPEGYCLRDDGTGVRSVSSTTTAASAASARRATAIASACRLAPAAPVPRTRRAWTR